MANRRVYRPDRHVYRKLRMNRVGRRRRLWWTVISIGTAIIAVSLIAFALRWLLR